MFDSTRGSLYLRCGISFWWHLGRLPSALHAAGRTYMQRVEQRGYYCCWPNSRMTWAHIGPYGPIRFQYGPTWVHVGPYGPCPGLSSEAGPGPDPSGEVKPSGKNTFLFLLHTCLSQILCFSSNTMVFVSINVILGRFREKLMPLA